jgi:hypothetical protein
MVITQKKKNLFLIKSIVCKTSPLIRHYYFIPFGVMLVKRSHKILRDFNARNILIHPHITFNFYKRKFYLNEKFTSQEKQIAKIFAAMISIKKKEIRGMLKHRLHF